MKGIFRAAVALILAAVAVSGAARAQSDGFYTLRDERGEVLALFAEQVYVDDEYISGDDGYYRVIAVDEAAREATARHLGRATLDEAMLSAFWEGAQAEESGRKLICMYSTHSDESYVPDDGDASLWKDAGIYDVGDRLKAALEERGIEAVYSHETFLPHDADAYTRSRRTAEEMLKRFPDALLDIHRDAVPAEQYETTVDGEDVSKVRLFVGRTNQNAAENKAFAQQIKAAADEAYPGLVKDIFIGKNNYNQDLYPHALLLEFGSHETDKDKAMASTGYMASVLDRVLYRGGKAQKRAESGAAAHGVIWLVVLAALAALIYAALATGGGKAALEKIKRRASEMTGGLLGKGPRE